MSDKKPFSLEEAFQIFKRIYPRGKVQYIPDLQMVRIMDKIDVTSKGVTGPEGPLFENVKNTYDKAFPGQRSQQQEEEE